MTLALVSNSREKYVRRFILLTLSALLLYSLVQVADAQTSPSSLPPLAEQSPTGILNGKLQDGSGGMIPNAGIDLVSATGATLAETTSDGSGSFSFPNVAPGPFRLRISYPGFATQETQGTLRSGETLSLPPITLILTVAKTEVSVGLSQTEVAQIQIEDEEKQRLFGILPNFYVSYSPDPKPLTPRQKFELAWRAARDPATFVFTGLVAGVQQLQGTYNSGYGQGVAGYAQRYGAAYGNVSIGIMLSQAAFRSLFRQDPRYFYRGTGSTKSRMLYAARSAVVCKSDSGHWQFCYSSLLGHLSASSISNLYYPSQDRHGVGNIFQSTGITVGGAVFGNILQEFIGKKLTRHAPLQGKAHSAQTP